MFIETHLLNDLDTSDKTLHFIKSKNIQVFPCGRRRSMPQGNSYSIPFDPESRLNTEANNVKHSSLNGFTQTYLSAFDTENRYLSVTLAGYLFNIQFDNNMAEGSDLLQSFCGSVEGANSTGKIYANIVLAKTPLFTNESLTLNYDTFILRDQTASIQPRTCLDLLKTPGKDDEGKDIILDTNDTDNYYFSGLSFSSTPVTGVVNATRSGQDYVKNDLQQRNISLCILERKNNVWQPHYPAMLPVVEHGEDENTVKLQDVLVNRVRQGQEKASIPSAKLEQQTGGSYQLQFFNVDVT